jgi:hypothetical protein
MERNCAILVISGLKTEKKVYDKLDRLALDIGKINGDIIQ